MYSICNTDFGLYPEIWPLLVQIATISMAVEVALRRVRERPSGVY